MLSATVLKAGAVYFALVFGAGFVLGTIRTIWVAGLGPPTHISGANHLAHLCHDKWDRSILISRFIDVT